MILRAMYCLAAAPAGAAEPAPLDVEFLDYLANCEGKDDNWTVVAARAPEKKASGKDPAPAKPPSAEAPRTEKQP